MFFPILHFGRHANGEAKPPRPPPPPLATLLFKTMLSSRQIILKVFMLHDFISEQGPASQCLVLHNNQLSCFQEAKTIAIFQFFFAFFLNFVQKSLFFIFVLFPVT